MIDLDYPTYLATPAQRAERLNADQLRRMAANQTIQRPARRDVVLSKRGVVFALALLAAAVVVGARLGGGL